MRPQVCKSGPSSHRVPCRSALCCIVGILASTCRGVNGCWQRVDNPVIWSDPGLAEAVCGSCAWSCIGDTCAAPDCNDGDYDGDGQPDCRCDLCGEEVSGTVFNSVTCRCESQIIDADGNIVSADGVEEPVCVGIEVDTNYVGGDCGCYEESPFVSYDGTHLRSLEDADACVRACAEYNMPKYVYRESSQQCWCKAAEAADVRRQHALLRVCCRFAHVVRIVRKRFFPLFSMCFYFCFGTHVFCPRSIFV